MKKCIACIYYDVVNLECSRLSEKFGLEEPVQVEMDWYCGDYADATQVDVDHVLAGITIKIGD